MGCVGRADFRGGLLGEDGLLALAFIEGLNQAQGSLVAIRERTQALTRSLAHLARIRAEESRRGRDDLAVFQREIERQMMPLDPPAPFPTVLGLAENRQEIQLGIAHRARPFLELAENLLEAHDRRGLQEARPAQARLDQGKRQRPLFRAQLLDRQPFAAAGMKCQLSRSGES